MARRLFHIADRRRRRAVPAGALLPRIKPVHTGERRIDWLGALLLVVAVGAPLAALELGFASGDHAHPGLALGLAVAGAAAIALLVRSNGAWLRRSSRCACWRAANRNC